MTDDIQTDYTAAEILAAFDVHYDGEIEEDLWFEGPARQRIKLDDDGNRVINEELTASRGWTNYVWEDAPFLLRGEPVEVKVLEQTGGMDEGSNASTVFKIGSQFFRKDGYYASHYGYDWDGDFYEVKAVEKTVIVYV